MCRRIGNTARTPSSLSAEDHPVYQDGAPKTTASILIAQDFACFDRLSTYLGYAGYSLISEG